MRSHRSLLFDADLEQERTNRITTTSGAHLTSDAVIDAPKMRAERRATRIPGTVARRERSDDTNDTPAQIRRLFQLRPERVSRRARCHETRDVRRMIAPQRAQAL